MGDMHARDAAEQVQDGLIDLRAALSWHLRGNHYPPLPEAFIDVAEKALEIAQEAGPYADEVQSGFFDPEMLDQQVVWPETPIMPRLAERNEEGQIVTSARVALDVMHLWDFVQAED